MSGKSTSAIGQSLAIVLVTLLIYITGFLLTGYLLFGNSAGPLASWLGFATFGVMVALVSAFRAWTAAQWLAIAYPWKIFAANAVLLVIGLIATMFVLLAVDEFCQTWGYASSLFVLSLTAAAIYSLLLVSVEAVVLWPSIRLIVFWLTAGWTANLLWWTLYLGMLGALAD